MKVKIDFVIHWLWTIVLATLALSGITMIGAKYGWILNYDMRSADYIHRVFSAVYVLLTFLAIYAQIIMVMKKDISKLPWYTIGPSGYQFFTLMTTLIFIVTGTMIWICMDSNMAAVSFAMYIHENLTYLVIGSLIWHIYDKSHALIWPKSKKTKASPMANRARG